MARHDAVHRYRAGCAWRGSTGSGYRSYSRDHEGRCPPAPVTVALSADPAFGGDPARLNPEQLVVLAASSCQLLSFLAEAARARIDVVAYDDADASADMPEASSPIRITEIVLRPTITVAGDPDESQVRRLVEQAHRSCYVANSLASDVRVEPLVRFAPSAGDRSTGGAPYPFGDTEAAARRLGRLAEVFEASSRELLGDAVPAPPALAVDLGCGPGHTTRLVADVTGAARVVGLDSSPAFVAAARAREPDLAFSEHDVTQVPLPVPAPDLLYCRFVLAHLARPEALVPAWVSQLAPGGVLCVEELEWIRTPEPVLGAYLDVAGSLVASRGGQLSVGPRLHALTEGPGWRQRSSRLRVLELPMATAAGLFAWNLSVWRSDPFVLASWPHSELDELAAGLEALAGSTSTRGVTWALRQVTFETVPGGD